MMTIDLFVMMLLSSFNYRAHERGADLALRFLCWIPRAPNQFLVHAYIPYLPLKRVIYTRFGAPWKPRQQQCWYVGLFRKLYQTRTGATAFSLPCTVCNWRERYSQAKWRDLCKTRRQACSHTRALQRTR